MNPQHQLIQYYKLLRQHGLNDSHSGNASIRTKDGFIITRTGACADTIQAEELIECSLSKPPSAHASLDATIHQYIYQQHPHNLVILHAHNPYTIALTLKKETFKPIDFEGQLYFSELNVIECAEKNYLQIMPRRISSALTNKKLTIVRSHGVYVSVENFDLAYKWICSLEQSAKIKYLAESL